MRFSCLVASALLVTGCGVPDVTFTDGGSSRDATRDSPGMDGLAEAEADAGADAEGDANGDAGDAATDAPEYCKPDAGPPSGLGCCSGGGGIVCFGNCNNAQACLKCGACTWPSVCCASGSTGTCTPSLDGGNPC